MDAPCLATLTWHARDGAFACMFGVTPHGPVAAYTCRIVGTANAVAAGWGNSAGGFVQLLMPLLLKVRRVGSAEPGSPMPCCVQAGCCAALCDADLSDLLQSFPLHYIICTLLPSFLAA